MWKVLWMIFSFVVVVQIFVYNYVFQKKKKQHSQNLSRFENEAQLQKEPHFENESSFENPFWKWKHVFGKLKSNLILLKALSCCLLAQRKTYVSLRASSPDIHPVLWLIAITLCFALLQALSMIIKGILRARPLLTMPD